jgi:hypothetical protein
MISAFAQLGLLGCFFACTWVGGCASPGEPTPPRSVVPVAIADLAARQLGNSVVLTFTLPRRSTDRELLTELPAIEVYRAALSVGTPPDKNTSWRLAYNIPPERTNAYLNGDIVEFRDPLAPGDLARAPGSQLGYKVRARSSRRAASADSNIVTADTFPAPAPPTGLHAIVMEKAIQLSWIPVEGTPASSYRVYRAQLQPGEAPSEPNLSKLQSHLEMIGPATQPTFNDTQFEFGRFYLYTVRSIAQFGTDAVESENSTTAIVATRDTFPPAAPTGIVAVLISATNQAPQGVELSWAISPEADLAGYFVYRSEESDVVGERISHEMLPSPAFRDISVSGGRTYFYRVSAVDLAGNESALSSAIQADIPTSVQ